MPPALTNHLWHSTVFALAAALLTLAFRRNRAHVRFWLWFAASFKFLVPFALLLTVGARLQLAPSAAPAVSSTIVQIAEPFPETLPLAPSPQRTRDWIPTAILALWSCGFATIALHRVRSVLRIRAAVRASTPLDLGAPLEIRSFPGLLEPGVVGFFRPILLLPAGIAGRLTPLQLEAVLAHELSHVRRRDNLLASVHMFVEAIFWFHPLIWWIGARLLEERERACDEEVLRLGSEPHTYADAILNVCELYVESPLVCVSGITGANLKNRIEAIMTNRTAQGLNHVRKLLLAGAGIAALAVPVIIGGWSRIGHAPTVRAQSPIAVPPMPQAAPVAAPAPAPAQDHRLVAMLFDFDAMTAGEQARAQQNAIDFVQHKMQPPDTVALMAVDNARVSIAQDFTGDPVVLLSAILKLNASGHTASAPGAGPRLSTIDAAARLLAVLPQKKMLMYFSSGVTKSRGENQAEIRSVIETAQQSNVALYVIDVSGPATATAEFEYARRQAYANANFGSPAGDRAVLTPMGRIYIKYGPPHQIAGPSSGPQIWRYNYLEDFRTNVEFEFPQASAGPRINWPPPSATFEGSPAVAPALAEALSRELESRGEPAAANPIAGLPGRHASLQIYPPREFRFLTVPLDSLAGRVDILAEIRAGNTVVANLRDWIPSSSAAFQAAFVLDPGSYVCRLIVREQSSGRMYGETIDFEVK